jgi:hypothetical protein
MASVSTPDVKSSTQALLPGRGLGYWRYGATFLLALLLLGLISRYAGGGSFAIAIAVVAAVAACGLWCLHMKTGRLGLSWSCSLAALLACQLLLPIFLPSAIPVSVWLGALGSGLFVYILLWLSAVYESEPGLQPLATYGGAACLLALAPPKKIYCLLLVLAGTFLPLLAKFIF